MFPPGKTCVIHKLSLLWRNSTSTAHNCTHARICATSCPRENLASYCVYSWANIVHRPAGSSLVYSRSYLTTGINTASRTLSKCEGEEDTSLRYDRQVVVAQALSLAPVLRPVSMNCLPRPLHVSQAARTVSYIDLKAWTSKNDYITKSSGNDGDFMCKVGLTLASDSWSRFTPLFHSPCLKLLF